MAIALSPLISLVGWQDARSVFFHVFPDVFWAQNGLGIKSNMLCCAEPGVVTFFQDI